MTIAYNKIESKETRRELRKNAPTPESIIWSKLRSRQMNNSKWRRQYGIGKYVLDFYCPAKRLAIEIDGESHFNEEAVAKDINREKILKSMRVEIIRFSNDEVMKNLEGVLSTINKYLT
jgi:very-short-patch-repair endonuclease